MVEQVTYNPGKEDAVGTESQAREAQLMSGIMDSLSSAAIMTLDIADDIDLAARSNAMFTPSGPEPHY